MAPKHPPDFIRATKLLAHSAVNAVIPGTDKVEYMIDNLNAGRGRLPDAAMRKRMTAFIDPLL